MLELLRYQELRYPKISTQNTKQSVQIFQHAIRKTLTKTQHIPETPHNTPKQFENLTTKTKPKPKQNKRTHVRRVDETTSD